MRKTPIIRIDGSRSSDGKYDLIAMAPDPFGKGDPIESNYGTASTVREANEFLDEVDGGRVEYNGRTVGYNWGEIVYVELNKNGEPKQVR